MNEPRAVGGGTGWRSAVTNPVVDTALLVLLAVAVAACASVGGLPIVLAWVVAAVCAGYALSGSV